MAKYHMPKKVDAGSAHLNKAGKYHFNVVSIDEQATTKSGGLFDGWKVALSVLEGTEATKQYDLFLKNVDVTKSETAQKWAMNKQVAFIIAAGLATEADMQDKEIDIDLQLAVNRQIVAELEVDKTSTGDRIFLQLAWANIFHIDDPRVVDVPKNAAALLMAPKSHRRDPKGFDLEKLGGKPSGSNGSANGAANGKSHQPAAPAVNVDDL